MFLGKDFRQANFLKEKQLPAAPCHGSRECQQNAVHVISSAI